MASLARRNDSICSKLNVSASCTLLVNPQHDIPSGSSCVGIPSPLQAHLALDKTAAGIKPASRDTLAGGFRLRSAWLRWLAETIPSAPNSTSPLRARCWSILSMTSLQTHLVLESPLPFRLILHWIRLAPAIARHARLALRSKGTF